jgi:histidinol-phosphate aminotransferase
VAEELDFLQDAVKRRGLRSFPTQANFFLIDVARNAGEVFEAMLREGVIVRSMESYGYPRYIRVNVGTRQENRRFLDALDRVLKTAPAGGGG